MKKFLVAGLAMVACASPALAADMPTKMYTKAPAMAPAFTWTGCYVGAQVGYSAAYSDPTWANGLPPGTPLTNRLNLNGALGGGTLGCNYQFAPNWVVGVEGDYSFASLNAGSPLVPPGNPAHVFSVKERSLATARARLGYATDRWLVFVTGGAAFARVEARDDNPPFADSETKTRTGWTVGGGAEYALMGNWSVKGEYLFADFGTSRYFTLPTVTLGGQADVPLKQHIFRLGLNYRFWGAN